MNRKFCFHYSTCSFGCPILSTQTQRVPNHHIFQVNVDTWLEESNPDFHGIKSSRVYGESCGHAKNCQVYVATLRPPAKSETFSWLHVKSHDQLKGAKGKRLT